MTKEEIIDLVIAETGLTMGEMKGCREDCVFSRYLIIVLMHEEGFSKIAIAKVFNVDRTGIYGNLTTIDNLLTFNKKFKSMYLACIARIAATEFNNDIEVYATAS